MTTIELAPAILDHLNQEPEDRKYWRSGYRSKNPDTRLPLAVYDNVTAAWMARERLATDPGYRRGTDAPEEVTRQQVTEIAKGMGLNAVRVYDEQRRLVEEWSV